MRSYAKFRADQLSHPPLLCAYMDHLQRVFAGVCQYEKFGWIRCCNFDNMQVLILCALSLKCVSTPPKIGGFGVSNFRFFVACSQESRKFPSFECPLLKREATSMIMSVNEPHY